MSDRAQPVLEGDGLRLRPFVPADVGGLVEAYGHPSIQQWHGWSLTRDEAQAWVVRSGELWSSERGANWAIEVDGSFAGRVGLRTVDLFEGVAEAAYWVLPPFRGRGLSVAGVGVMTSWCFVDLGLHRMELLHSTRNEVSCRVADKAGFVFEGTLRESVLHEDGWHDMHLHARLAAD
jgi:RimJ/RimL family protein N-acetyltransferase